LGISRNNMRLEEFNKLDTQSAAAELKKCCGSTRWIKSMIENIPFDSVASLKKIAEIEWQNCNAEDRKEAFSHHPKIGEKKVSAVKTGNATEWAQQEQSGMNTAEEQIQNEMTLLNEQYEKKFGFIYIVFATGKSAEEMLRLLQKRINNTAEEELKNAGAEQIKITQLRIDKLFS
jgi:2-oxo-4-hydroxy-4-carboxy-5-ureidoimidazoline decarboxylase